MDNVSGDFDLEGIKHVMGVVLKSGKDPSSEDLKPLAEYLNFLQAIAKARSTELAEEEKSTTCVGQAVATLLECMPRIRGRYLYETREDLEAFDTLMDAAKAFAERQILRHPLMLGPEVERWTGYARQMMETFRRTTGNKAKENAYRFIVAVTPQITGETPTFEAVKSELKRERDLSRGKKNRSLP
jgi:hypothetical protein